MGNNPWLVIVRDFVMTGSFSFLLIVLGLLLTHSTRPAEKALTGAVANVHVLAVRDTRKADDQSSDRHMLVICVEKHHVPISDRSALASVKAHALDAVGRRPPRLAQTLARLCDRGNSLEAFATPGEFA